MNKKSGILWLSWLDTKLHADLLFFFFLKLELTRNSVCYYSSGFIYFLYYYLFACLLETQGFTMEPWLAWTCGYQPASAGVNGESPPCSTGCLHFKPWYHVEFLPCFDFLMQWLPGGSKNRSLRSLRSHFSCSSTPSVCLFICFEGGCGSVSTWSSGHHPSAWIRGLHCTSPGPSRLCPFLKPATK